MIISLLYDTDLQSIVVYKDYECFYSATIKLYKDLSIDQLIEIGAEYMKRAWRSIL